MKPFFTHILITFLFICAGSIAANAQSVKSPRERTSFNDNWRFQKDDPKDAEGVLAYEKIKDWVKATGNEFVVDGEKTVRPAGNVGGNVVYTQENYDDAAWRNLDLPHDWAIEGDFQQELPGETGKRPWMGTGWYRKHFSVSKDDKGKQIYLDFDGAMSHASVWLNGKFVGGWVYGYSSFRLDLTTFFKFRR